ncbi:MAG: HAD-IA family hydrolase [Pseudomonadota bacterium]
MAEAALKLIMFDFDGTLVDSQHSIVAAMGAAFEGEGLAAPGHEKVRRVVGLNLESAIDALVPREARSAVDTLAARYRETFFKMRTAEDFHEPLFPGVHEILGALQQGESLLGIATGKNRRGLLASMERHGLAGYFTLLKTADDGPSKPHPEILRQAMAEIGVGPRDTMVVGDTTYDMIMARNAQAWALGVSWGYHPPEELTAAGAFNVLTSFDELHPALAVLEQAP